MWRMGKIATIFPLVNFHLTLLYVMIRPSFIES
jgi:hypothetical protein